MGRMGLNKPRIAASFKKRDSTLRRPILCKSLQCFLSSAVLQIQRRLSAENRLILKLRGKSPAGLQLRQQANHNRPFQNRSLRIIVHRNDHLSVLDAGCMLNSAGDAETDVKIRGNHLTRLSYLPIIGTKSHIDGSTGCSNGSTNFIGQLFKRREPSLINKTRPPATTTLAETRSGRSLSVSVKRTN